MQISHKRNLRNMANTTETRRVKIITDAQQSTASLNQLRASVASINKELNKTERGTEHWNRLNKELGKAKRNYAAVRGQVAGLETAQTRFWRNAKSAMAGFMASNLITAAVQGLFSFVQSIKDFSMKTADALSGVKKTTGLTTEEVNNLSNALGELDTRTSKNSLLEIAQQAGKLGITGTENLRQFTKAFDQINVALGEDLGNEGITNIAKMNDLFGETKRLGIEKSMLATASAINSLGQSGTAQEGYIVDFTKRLAGIAVQSGISIDSILGLGATLDELGQTSEVSSTSLTQLFIQMQKDSGTYAKLAGINVSEFNKLLKEDANAAFISFLKGLNKNSEGMKGLAQNFEALGVDGTRAIGVISALAQNTDKLTARQELSKKEFMAGNSVLNEFNENNTNVAAKIEKAWKKLYGFLMNNLIAKAITGLIEGFADLIIGEQKQVDAVEEGIKAEQRRIDKFNILMDKLKDAGTSENDRKEIIKMVNTEYKDYLPNLVQEGDSIDTIAKKQNLANEMLLKNIALKKSEAEISKQMTRFQEANDKAREIRTKLLGERTDAYDAYSNPEGSKNVAKLNTELIKHLSIIADSKTKIDGIMSSSQNMLNAMGVEVNNNVSTNMTSVSPTSKSTAKEEKAKKEKKKKEEETMEEFVDRLAKHNKDVENLIGEGSESQNKMISEIYEARKKEQELYWEELQKQIEIQYLQGTITQEQRDAIHLENELKRYQNEIDLADEFGMSKTDIALAHERRLFDEKAKLRAMEEDLQQRAADKWADVENTAIQGALTLARQYYQKNADMRNKAIEERYRTEVNGVNVTEEERAKIEAKYADIRRTELRKQAIETRALAIFEIAVNTARAIVLALAQYGPAGVPLSIALGALGAVQAGVVAAAPMPEFATGGLTMVQGQSGNRYNASNAGSFSKGGGVNSPSYGIIGEKGPEFVIPNWLYTAPEWASTMSSLENAVSGGSASTRSDNNGKSDAVMKALIQMVGKMDASINKLDAKLSKPISAVTYFNEDEYRKKKAQVDLTRKIALGERIN